MDTLLVALDCLFVVFLLRCSVFIFYLNVVLLKECAKCIVVMQPTLFLLLCLTFAKRNGGISLAQMLSLEERSDSFTTLPDVDLPAQFG